MISVKEWKLEPKVVCLGADNCNTNFGGQNRTGLNNVFYHLKQKLNHGLIGIGCCAHIVHNGFCAGCDKIPLEIEGIVVKIYRHFHIYTKRVESLKEFCAKADVDFEMVTKHSRTRFLSLLPGAEKINKMYEPLKDYFKNAEDCPQLIQKFFNDPHSRFWLNFLEYQLSLSNECVKEIETKNDASFAVSESLQMLLMKLENRKNLNIIPRKARDEYNNMPSKSKEEIDG